MIRQGAVQRRASAYVAVLGTAIALMVIGYSSLIAARVDRRATQSVVDYAQARLLAQSALEIGFHYVRSDASWRTNHSDGVWFSNLSLGSGKFSLEGTDPGDANLKDSDHDPLVLTGIGTSGVATYKLAVTLTARETPLSCLEAPLISGNDLLFQGGTVVADAPLSSNRAVSAVATTVNAPVEAVSTITGSTFNATTSPGEIAKTLPDTTVFDYYIANGTAINYSALPSSGKIENVVLSPASSPYGAANANGIYVIDCGNQDITIRNARIVGTLVLLNVAGASSATTSVNWQPAVANFPSLLVRGKFTFDLNTTALDEGSLGVNLNPSGAAYKGVSDADISDTYPSKLEGLFYASSDVTLSKQLSLDGVLVSGNDLIVQAGATLTYDQKFKDNPPPGFRDKPEMVVSPGSFQPVVE